jgi:hypothetical protein
MAGCSALGTKEPQRMLPLMMFFRTPPDRTKERLFLRRLALGE